MASLRNLVRYCCPAWRQAVRNVLDREHKWLARDTLDSRTKRAIEYKAARRQQSEALVHHRRRHTVAPTS